MNTHEIASEISQLVPRLIKGTKSRYLLSKEISTTQLIILTNLEIEPEITLKKLSSNIGVTPATASVMVDKLVKAGQIKRSEDPRDRRRIKIVLTAAGKHKLQRFRKEIENFWFRMLKRSLGPKEQKTFLNIMKKVVNELENE
jgi:DNA-binding MarR family transcriptional regulator